MTDGRAERLALKRRLARTWDAFFARHGNFTPAQLATIPALLDDRNVVVCAPTASGKTEAVIAPLIERHCNPVPADAPNALLRILYIVPTRALTNDLYRRLRGPLESLRLALAVKTRDLDTFDASHPAHVLITTPESADSLLTSSAKTFANLRAVILDELHLFDGTPRGDHLRVILRRLRRIRAYAAAQGDAPDTVVQYAALSASMPEPEVTATRYFPDPHIIHVTGRRAIEAEHFSLAPDSATALIDYLRTFRSRGWRKALVFCNTRAEVEAYAAAVQGQIPFGGAIYVHYSNFVAERRKEIEEAFASAEAAICFASSTLELGIDIGNIDVVALIGPPGNVGSFLQRIGRGNRLTQVTRAVCFWRTSLERLAFEALCANTDTLTGNNPMFRPGVAVQQLFSLIKQSPTGAVRLAELAHLFDAVIDSADLEAILGHLTQIDYLTVGRPGEWRAGPKLNTLLDQQATQRNPLSIYSNIQSADRVIEIREQYTQRTIAHVGAQWFDRPALVLEGRPVNVEWFDGEAVWVRSQPSAETPGRLHYQSARQLFSLEFALLLAAQLGLPPGAAPYFASEGHYVWFHWLGDLYGTALLELLRPYMSVITSEQPGICLLLGIIPDSIPELSEAQVRAYLEREYRRYEPMMALSPFHHLLPSQLRKGAVVAQFDVARFLAKLRAIQVVQAPEYAQEKLNELGADCVG